ncbi:flagellar biosynthetic protein FliQ [Falsiroseomonas sp.]|uniref:flagellar biosynthetic protein FliQ n=1 Tax=Falsiroseomonas sp. TaxID=2870721 RepID=UPI0027210F5B|nr:flagellar biosynthetic protein FliQ [Falsiroseomonas sp.]MDO9499745.1 flagellar biosynthetic protein FliQ [Falsiroseomonas sp.]MDP3414832.1 flagellar biosynthetic protein FliQ [Falsiroseomonas sp.]
MSEQAMGQALREALWVATQVMGPPLLAVLAIGLVVSLVQALTQIQEATLAFVPKLVMGGALMLLLGPFTAQVMTSWTEALFDRMIQIGGAP